ncbi:MAG TPA: exodeoxyribonuclease VII large subunit [Anaerolineales bacterium]|nr:exodeoxyribonuclease VII large subunit [Anaerolineales bacterium]
MEQLALFDASPRWTVTDLTRHLRQVLEADSSLQGVWVQGEVSNLSRPSSGHVYFTLKDAGASLRCVIWRNDAARLRFPIQDGLAIEAHGSISIYEVGGQYQLYADALRPLGEGALYQEFLRLKALLEAEGLFDAAQKRSIPEFPHRIGIVTSPTGAALRDILNTLLRRLPLAEVILAPAPVQGDEAPRALVGALQALNRIVAPDVILLARGGGSIEDLWAFNDETLVRAIAGSAAPVISGVGHETDFTLADFAADLRAPTPTAAAELSTPITLLDLKANLVEFERILQERTLERVGRQRDLAASLEERLRFYSPLRRLQTERQRLDDLSRRAIAAPVHRMALSGEKLKGMENRLLALSPNAVLGRGYAVVTKNDRVVNSKSQVQAGDALRIRVRDGEFDARASGNG